MSHTTANTATTTTAAATSNRAKCGRGRAASLLRRLCLPATAAALCSGLLIAPEAEARSGNYCHIDANGNYACIERVSGPRHNRSLLYSINGYLYSSRHNCYDYNYGAASLVSVACWNYRR